MNEISTKSLNHEWHHSSSSSLRYFPLWYFILFGMWLIRSHHWSSSSPFSIFHRSELNHPFFYSSGSEFIPFSSNSCDDCCYKFWLLYLRRPLEEYKIQIQIRDCHLLLLQKALQEQWIIVTTNEQRRIDAGDCGEFAVLSWAFYCQHFLLVRSWLIQHFSIRQAVFDVSWTRSHRGKRGLSRNQKLIPLHPSSPCHRHTQRYQSTTLRQSLPSHRSSRKESRCKSTEPRWEPWFFPAPASNPFTVCAKRPSRR